MAEKKNKKRLSVIIATYNRSKSLDRCLSSLVKQRGGDFEVVIVDGGSEDQTDKVIIKYSQKLKLRKLVYPYFELAEVRDFGFRNSKGQYLAFIDDDVVVNDCWVESLIKIFDQDDQIGGLTGPTIIPINSLKKRDAFYLQNKDNLLSIIWKKWFLENQGQAIGKIFRSGAWSQGTNFQDCLKIRGMLEVDYLEACNMALRRDLVEKVGGFDLRYRKTAEWCELDLALKIKKLGYQLKFSSQLAVEHRVSAAGVFDKRVKAKHRMENFFRFYFTHIFKFRFDYIIRFASYLFFLNAYWIYKFLKSGNIGWLGGIVGNISGVIKMGIKNGYKN